MLPAGSTEHNDVGQGRGGNASDCACHAAAHVRAWVRADSLYHAAAGRAGARHAHAGHAAHAGFTDDADDVAHGNLACAQRRRKRLRIDDAAVVDGRIQGQVVLGSWVLAGHSVQAVYEISETTPGDKGAHLQVPRFSV